MAIQAAYWNSVGATKTFTHPLDLDWLRDVRRDARVLDYGCGYGRLMSVLTEHGFTDVSGVDVSAALVERGRAAHPELRFDVMERPPQRGRRMPAWISFCCSLCSRVSPRMMRKSL